MATTIFTMLISMFDQLGYPAFLVSTCLPTRLDFYKHKRFGGQGSDQNYWGYFPIMVGRQILYS